MFNRYAFLHLATPIKPSSPELNNQAAAEAVTYSNNNIFNYHIPIPLFMLIFSSLRRKIFLITQNNNKEIEMNVNQISAH